MSPKTIEATYENGLLRPLEPIEDAINQIYLITILDVDRFCTRRPTLPARDLRGKYRGYLSSADEYARNKLTEKNLER